jgi:hypothetical protein
MRAWRLSFISALRLRGSSRIQLVIDGMIPSPAYRTVVKSVDTVWPAVLMAKYIAGR